MDAMDGGGDGVDVACAVDERVSVGGGDDSESAAQFVGFEFADLALVAIL